MRFTICSKRGPEPMTLLGLAMLGTGAALVGSIDSRWQLYEVYGVRWLRAFGSFARRRLPIHPKNADRDSYSTPMTRPMASRIQPVPARSRGCRLSPAR